MPVIFIFFKNIIVDTFKQKHERSVKGISLKYVHCDTCNIDFLKGNYNGHLQTQKTWKICWKNIFLKHMYCDPCNIDILEGNYNRHLQTQ